MKTAILNAVGKEMKNGYLNGKIPESVIMSSFNKNKREADSFSVFGYRQWEIERMLKECFNPLLKDKLQEHLNKMRSISQKSADQNRKSLEKLERFKREACGIGLRKVLGKMDKLAKMSKDPEAKLTLLLLETEYANLSAKQHKKWLKRKIYQRKNILMCQMAGYLKKVGWKYGINYATGKNANYLVYVYLPNGVQLTWHCNEYNIYKCYPLIDAEWDGQVCMTMEKLLSFIEKKYLSNN